MNYTRIDEEGREGIKILSLQHELRDRVKRVEEHDRRPGSARIRKGRSQQQAFGEDDWALFSVDSVVFG